MMMTTHALFGAALGRIAGNRPAAFLLGIASHALGDVLPHNEFPMKVDVPIATAALAVMSIRYGITSPEVAGALGGIAPDAEHIPTFLGLREEDSELFPTHGAYPQPWPHSMGHQPETNTLQYMLALSSFVFLCAELKKEK